MEFNILKSSVSGNIALRADSSDDNVIINLRKKSCHHSLQ